MSAESIEAGKSDSGASDPGKNDPGKSDPGMFSFGGKTHTEAEYMGKTGLGPVGEQFIKCPKCSTQIHKFSIRCHECGLVIREIGKIDSGPRGSSTKGVGFVVGILVLAMGALILAERGYSGGKSLGVVIPLSLVGFVLGVNGLLGLLYFRYFALLTFVKGLTGFIIGGVSFVVAVVCLLLLL